MQLVKKITIKKCAGEPKRLILRADPKDADGVPKDGAKLPILRVLGRVTGASLEMTDYGEYVRLRGQFRATQLSVGEGEEAETFSSSVCILPDVASLPIYEALNASGSQGEVSDAEKSETDDEGKKRRSRTMRKIDATDVLEFAYDIVLEADSGSNTGCVFACTPLVEESGDDPLARLEQQVTARLEAPKPRGKAAAAK